MTCVKDAYDSFHLARKIARRMVDRTKRTTGRTTHTIEPYHCTNCGLFHVTSYSTPKLRKVA